VTNSISDFNLRLRLRLSGCTAGRQLALVYIYALSGCTAGRELALVHIYALTSANHSFCNQAMTWGAESGIIGSDIAYHSNIQFIFERVTREAL
jgi:hypothetical protein